MSDHADVLALAEPPEGVIAGENVPRASEPDEYDRRLLDQVVAELKTRPGYSDQSDGELLEIAKQKLGGL